MLNGNVVSFESLMKKNPVLVYIDNKIEGVVAMDDIPKVILSVPVTSRAIFTDPLDRFVCNTMGNLLCDMAQTPENFKWREKLIDMQMSGDYTDEDLLVDYALWE